jgi:hypothetical protein
MSRWQPPRDWSPPRFSERRPPAVYSGPPGQNTYRNSNDPNQIPIDRAPPRGPKADNARASYQFTPPSRGRGAFVNRSDGWERDRDPRDARPAPSSYRRDDDRSDWPRRERDFNPPDRGALAHRDSRGYVGRNRSASPSRPLRRDSKEALYSNFSRPGENMSSYGPSTRGGAARGRGRGDWDRPRGRNSFAGDRDRDLFGTRSRSGEGWREKERDRDRPREEESDRGDRYDRRDLDRSRERDIRGREYDSWQRERSPGRSDSGNFGAVAATPTPTGNAVSGDVPHAGAERTVQRAGSDFGRRPSAILTPTNLPKDMRKDGDASDYFIFKPDPSRRDTGGSRQFSPPAIAEIVPSSTLDYGPPPPAISSSNLVTDKVVTAKAPVPKEEPPVQTPFLPPTGPKADRAGGTQAPLAVASRGTALDSWAKSDSHPRTLRPGPAPALGLSTADQTPKRLDTSSETRNPPAAPSDRNMPPMIPLGPRSTSRLAAGDLNAASTPPIAPKGGSRPLPGEYRSNIPTGPRLATVQWSPDYKPAVTSRPPSIMSAMNNKAYYIENRDRQPFASGPQRPGPSYPSQPSRPRIFQPSIMNRTTDNYGIDTGKGSESILGPSATLNDQRRQSRDKSDGIDPDVSMNASSEDEDGLDEDDFQDSEDKFQKEMKILESKKPLPPLKDPMIVTLLLRIQMLGMIAGSTVPATFESKADGIESSQSASVLSSGLLSPERQPDELPGEDHPSVECPHPFGRPLKEPPVNPIPTPPIEDLPYLQRHKEPQLQIFDDSDNEVEYEAMSVLIRQEFEKSAWEWRDELDDLKNSYREYFHAWRDGVSNLELQRELKASTPTPASPALSVAPSITPQLTHERTRGGKNATDLDLQNAIRISEQSAREEEERRAREKSKPNYETEAVVPPMLQSADIEMLRFKDTNQLIPGNMVLEKFALIPPVDDFDDEEQKIFITNYCQYPKKWGKIAESLPGRDFQQCIAHYYLTKDEANYKESVRRAQPRKRRGRLPTTQPRSTALLTENMFAEDAENPPMTDSGRPKRAAAPVFGDTGTDPDTTPVPQSSKRLAAGSKDSNGEQGPTKATRGRKAGTGTKVRRTKAQILEDQMRAQMQQNGTEISPHKGDGLGNRQKTLPRGGSLKADPSQGLDIQRSIDVDVPTMPILSASEFPIQPAVAGSAVSTGPQITSYWSVPEQQKFPSLVAYFGRDFAAIADFMKTKSVIMVKLPSWVLGVLADVYRSKTFTNGNCTMARKNLKRLRMPQMKNVFVVSQWAHHRHQ